jgi:hypothetical protein
MARYTRFSVNLPEEEGWAFKEALEESDFEYDPRDRYRSNGEYAQFIRYLVRETMVEEDEP